MTKIYRFDFVGGGYITSEDMNFAEHFAKLVGQYGLPTNIELSTGYHRQTIRGAIQAALDQGCGIVASGSDGVEFPHGRRVSIDVIPGGYAVIYSGNMTVCTEEQLTDVLLLLDREIIPYGPDEED